MSLFVSIAALSLIFAQATSAFTAPATRSASSTRSSARSSVRSSVRLKPRMVKPSSSSKKALLQGAYLDFNPAIIGNGKTSVLFFKASWCGTCKSTDADLRKLFNETSLPLAIYRVDYDTYPQLRKKYRVSYQHTFVKIDGQGNFVTAILRPDLDKLKAFLSN